MTIFLNNYQQFRSSGSFSYIFAVPVLFILIFCPGSVSGQKSPDISGFPEIMEMTLTEAVFLSLRYNRSLESAYLDRVMQRFNLRQDLTKFHPNLEISLGADARLSEDSSTYKEDDIPKSRITTHSTGTYVTTRATQKIPTGAEISFVWDNEAQSRHVSRRDGSTKTEPLDSAWGVELSQPLLKGGGIDFNTASVTKARLGEEEAVRSMRDTVISTVTGVIMDYRNLLRASQDLNVQQTSLKKAREQLEILKSLINAGRRAANELIQSEANVARQELSVEEAKSTLNDAQLSLLNKLNIGREIIIIPTEQVEYRQVEPDIEECLEIVFKKNADYLRALNQVKIAGLNIMEAENQRRWDLSAEARYRKGWHQRRTDPDYRQDEWSVGLSLDIPFPIYGDAKYARESPLLSARINLRKAEMTLLTIEENLENEVATAVRRVDSAHKQVQLARRTRELSEKSFEVSELEYRLGRISNTDFIREQDKLRNDKLAEVNSIIAYENTLTSLDQLLATTLDTWEIDFTPQRADLEEEMLGRKTWMLGK